MASSEFSSETPGTIVPNNSPATGPIADVAPPIGITPPQILAEEAATGRRGAAWRLLVWVIENDPRAVVAVSSLEDERLAQHLLEFIALGTWAGKPFVIPKPLRTAHARTRLRTLFLPGAGMNGARAEHVLLAAIHDRRVAMRENAVHILGIIGSASATPVLVAALEDSTPTVRIQAAKALGRVRDPSAIPALLNALRNADEQLGSQIISALVHLGPAAVPALLERSTNSSAWVRWHCVRALGETTDRRAIPVLVNALRDSDHAVAWMGAKSLLHFGKQSLVPLLRLLMTTETSQWFVETASFVLRDLGARNTLLKPYLDPVIQDMHSVSYRTATPIAAQRALAQLSKDGFIESL